MFQCRLLQQLRLCQTIEPGAQRHPSQRLSQVERSPSAAVCVAAFREDSALVFETHCSLCPLSANKNSDNRLNQQIVMTYTSCLRRGLCSPSLNKVHNIDHFVSWYQSPHVLLVPQNQRPTPSAPASLVMRPMAHTTMHCSS